MKAADIMTQRVITIRDDASIEEAARLMLQDKISGLPVLNRDAKLAGIVTEGDFLRRAETGTQKRRSKWLELLLGSGKLAEDYVQTHGRRVAEVMSRDVVTVTEDSDLVDVINVMESRNIKRVVVMRGEEIVGLVSRNNLMQALARLAPEAEASLKSDQDIRARILGEIAQLPWMPSRTTNLIVRNGTVSLHGTVFDDKERQALRVLAENTPGVKAVEDHLVWIDPYSGMVIDQDNAV